MVWRKGRKEVENMNDAELTEIIDRLKEEVKKKK